MHNPGPTSLFGPDVCSLMMCRGEGAVSHLWEKRGHCPPLVDMGGVTAHMWGTSLLTPGGLKGSQWWAVDRILPTSGASKGPLDLNWKARASPQPCGQEWAEGPYPLQPPKNATIPGTP